MDGGGIDMDFFPGMYMYNVEFGSNITRYIAILSNIT